MLLAETKTAERIRHPEKELAYSLWYARPHFQNEPLLDLPRWNPVDCNGDEEAPQTDSIDFGNRESMRGQNSARLVVTQHPTLAGHLIRMSRGERWACAMIWKQREAQGHVAMQYNYVRS